MRRAETCYVADDHPGMVSAITDVLSARGYTICGSADNGVDALAGIERLGPEIAVLDVRMPRASGTEVARRLHQAGSKTSVVLYSGHGDRALVSEAIDAGARAFVLKEAPLAELVRAIETVAAGDVYLDPVLAGVLATSASLADLPALTTREREVLRLLANGGSNEAIGRALSISPETVRTTISKAMAKLEADTRTQAVAIAIRQSLIT